MKDLKQLKKQFAIMAAYFGGQVDRDMRNGLDLFAEAISKANAVASSEAGSNTEDDTQNPAPAENPNPAPSEGDNSQNLDDSVITPSEPA